MDINEAIQLRHSVRQYKTDPIPEETKSALRDVVEQCNKESGLKIQVIYEDPNTFTGFLANYGKFKNAQNYIALVGAESQTLEETAGYYGQRIVLFFNSRV